MRPAVLIVAGQLDTSTLAHLMPYKARASMPLLLAGFGKHPYYGRELCRRADAILKNDF